MTVHSHNLVLILLSVFWSMIACMFSVKKVAGHMDEESVVPLNKKSLYYV